MAQPIAPDYGQQFLFPPALEDWVPKDHPVRFIREFVDQQDLARLGFSMPISLEGRPAYAPALLLKIWLYGYHHRVRSTRKLEAACRDQLALLWLAGTLAPDHNSLWRFWRDNKQALRGLFQQSVRLAVNAGLVGLALQAVDGTKIQAVGSPHTGWSKDKMEKLLAALDRELEETEKQLEQEGPAPEGTGYRLPEKLEDRQALREAVKRGLDQLEQDGREHYHPKEPEARRMKCEGRKPFAYNAQAVVDESHGVVVAAEACVEEGDTAQLVEMIQQAQQNTASEQPVLTVADGGYGSGAQVAAAAEQKMNVLVWPHTEAVQAMRQRLKGAQEQEQLARRGQIIERHFGQIKQHDGFRRWTVRGVENVRTQWALINLTSNLRVLYRLWNKQRQELN